MTKEEALKFIAQSIKSDVDMAMVADAIEALLGDEVKEEYDYVNIGNGCYVRYYKPKTEATEREEAIKQCEAFIKNHSDWSVEVEWANGVEFVLEDYKRLIKQEPTTRNCFGCKHAKDNHNSGTEECHLCMWENQYTPTTKNDLGVDCIKKSDAINIIQDMHGLARADVISDAVNRIIAMPSVTPQEPRWIPVSERLPDKNVWVLVTVEQSGMCHQEIMRRNKYIEAWTDNIDNYTDEITAWMPLPQPYSEVEE